MATQIEANLRRVSAGGEFEVKLGLRLPPVKYEIDARVEVAVTCQLVKRYLCRATIGRQIVGPHAQWLLAHQLPQATRLLPGKGGLYRRRGSWCDWQMTNATRAVAAPVPPRPGA